VPHVRCVCVCVCCRGMNQFLYGSDRPPPSSFSSSDQKRSVYHTMLPLIGTTLSTGTPYLMLIKRPIILLTLFFIGSLVASSAAVSTVSRLFVLMADGAEETLVENCLKGAV
jgi:hypothetical protein